MKRKYTIPVFSRYFRKEWAGLCAIPKIIARNVDEARWAREVQFIDGPTLTDTRIEPVSRKKGWPFIRIAPLKPHPLEKVLCALEAARPSKVIRMKGVV